MPSMNDVEMVLKLDTRDFDRQIKRVRRRLNGVRVWIVAALALYAAAMTGATVTLAALLAR